MRRRDPLLEHDGVRTLRGPLMCPLATFSGARKWDDCIYWTWGLARGGLTLPRCFFETEEETEWRIQLLSEATSLPAPTAAPTAATRSMFSQ